MSINVHLTQHTSKAQYFTQKIIQRAFRSATCVNACNLLRNVTFSRETLFRLYDIFNHECVKNVEFQLSIRQLRNNIRTTT